MGNTNVSGRKVFRIGLGGDVEYGLLPCLLRRLRQEAPGVLLIIRRLENQQLAEQLVSGELSVALSYGKEVPKDVHRVRLRLLRLKLLRSDIAPHLIELAEYCRRPHAQVHYSGDVSEYIDSELLRKGRSRRIEISLSQFSSLPLLMADTDLLATVPDYVADTLVATGGLRAQALPLELPPVELSMTWNEALDGDVEERWLRSRLKMLLTDVDTLD